MTGATAVALVVWGMASEVWGQAPTLNPRPQTPNPVPQTSLQVYLVTIGQGEYIWEKFGHNALWFRDSATGVDVAYNWGIFDFEQPGFVRRFLRAEMKYWVDGYPGPTMLDYYRQSDRTIVIQRLNFTPAQAQKAYDYARWNAREENKYYRYDYFRDNCSTRVRDIVDLALGGALKAATANRRVARTYRSESIRLTSDTKLMQLGIYTALGPRTDRPLSTWEEMFIPMRMRDALREIRVPGARSDTTPVSLIAAERIVYESRRHRERRDVPKLWIPYLIVGVLLALELIVIGRVGERSSGADKVFRVEVALWALVTGILGTVLLFLWTSTHHVFAYYDENLLLLSPLALWLAMLIVMSIWRPRWLRPAAIIAVIIAMLSAAAVALKGLPWFMQDNVALILLFLPPHFAIAYGLQRRAIVSPKKELEIQTP